MRARCVHGLKNSGDAGTPPLRMGRGWPTETRPFSACVTVPNLVVLGQTVLATTTPPQAVRAYSSGCSLRGPLTCATSIHRSPPCWLASPKWPTSSVLASNNRQRSRTTQPWTSLCITASNGSSFLATHRGNGYALRAWQQMMMMVLAYVWRDPSTIQRTDANRSITYNFLLVIHSRQGPISYRFRDKRS